MTQASVREAQSGERRGARGTSPSADSRRAVVLTVGDEILRGDIINTNAAYLSEQATALGFDVVLHQSVADDIAIIGDVVQRAASLADLVLISGGLGPTTDDLTSEAVAVAFGGSLIRSERAEAQLRVFFEARGREIASQAGVVQRTFRSFEFTRAGQAHVSSVACIRPALQKQSQDRDPGFALWRVSIGLAGT